MKLLSLAVFLACLCMPFSGYAAEEEPVGVKMRFDKEKSHLLASWLETEEYEVRVTVYRVKFPRHGGDTVDHEYRVRVWKDGKPMNLLTDGTHMMAKSFACGVGGTDDSGKHVKMTDAPSLVGKSQGYVSALSSKGPDELAELHFTMMYPGKQGTAYFQIKASELKSAVLLLQP